LDTSDELSRYHDLPADGLMPRGAPACRPLRRNDEETPIRKIGSRGAANSGYCHALAVLVTSSINAGAIIEARDDDTHISPS
jgi:hypothetical protein